MAIKGLTDRGPVIPAIGELRKGGEKSDSRIGRDLTYFRFTSQNADVVKAFLDAYGPEPASVEVYLPYRTVEENFESWREAWVSGGLRHRCDGETCVLWQDDMGKFHTEPRACPGECKPVGRLHCVIPALERFGTVTALTTSVNDIISLTASLQAVSMFRDNLRGIPFILSRRPRKIGTPGAEGKRRRAEKWLLHIEPSPAWFGRGLAAASREALMLTEGEIEEAPPGDPFEPVEVALSSDDYSVRKSNGTYFVTDGDQEFAVFLADNIKKCTCTDYADRYLEDSGYMCTHKKAVSDWAKAQASV